jgi:SEC-C motif-containing protein
VNPSQRGSAEAGGPCPCGRGQAYDRCCGPLHRGERDAATAEQLMRSRYAAYAVGDGAYLLRSWAAATRPDHVVIDTETTWTGLTVVASTGGAMLDTEGTVTFDAHHRTAGRDGVLHERSRFSRDDGRWVYLGPDASA